MPLKLCYVSFSLAASDGWERETHIWLDRQVWHNNSPIAKSQRTHVHWICSHGAAGRVNEFWLRRGCRIPAVDHWHDRWSCVVPNVPVVACFSL